jgi:hypothetical protein
MVKTTGHVENLVYKSIENPYNFEVKTLVAFHIPNSYKSTDLKLLSIIHHMVFLVGLKFN